MRSLNLSYNSLHFDQNSPRDLEHSENFMANMRNFFALAKFVNHVDFSHMKFTKEKMLDLIEILKECEFLL